MKEDRRANGSQGTWWVWARSKDSPVEVGGAPSHFAAPGPRARPRRGSAALGASNAVTSPHQPWHPRTRSALTRQRLKVLSAQTDKSHPQSNNSRRVSRIASLL